MPEIKTWITAFRLRTLPLALSSILMGSFIAVADEKYNLVVIALSLTTTLFLQILSNLANDYGDGVKGTDNQGRVGPMRAIQSGDISPMQMKIGIAVFVLLSLVSGIWLIVESLGTQWYLGLLFLAIGIAAIAAAIKYTVGKNAYGYSGLGDLFVFVFFGLVAVLGTYYLNSHGLNWGILLPASSMGLLSAGVLNLNNMRDIVSDANSGKHTFALLLGIARAKLYHNVIIILAMVLMLIYVAMNYDSLLQFLFAIAYPIMIFDLIRINKISINSQLDPYLKRLALSTLLLTVLFGLGIILG